MNRIDFFLMKNAQEDLPQIDDVNETIKQWQANPTPELFDKLYNKYEDTINRGSYIFAGGYSNPLPKMATKAHALKAFNTAINTYDPSKGGALSTWITAQMRALQRYVRDNKDIAHIPENRLIHVGMLREREMFLSDKLGRAPSLSELSDDLKWPVKKIKMIKSELRRDLMGNRGLDELAVKTSGKVESLLRGLYYDVPGLQQKILEHTFGWDENDKLTIKEMAKKLKLPEAKIRYERDKLAKRIKKDYSHELSRL